MIPRYVIFLRIFILSAAVIAFEIILTRISSLIFTYNYAFMIVSLAILGLGSGGVFSFFRWNIKAEKERDNITSELSIYNLLFSLFITFFIVLVTLVPPFTNPSLFFIITFIPFFFAGVVLSKTFQLFATYSFKLYAFDLLGAAVGSILALLILDILVGTNAVIILSILGVISSLLYISRHCCLIQLLKVMKI